MTVTREFRTLLSLHSASVLNSNPVVAAAYESDFESNHAAFSEFANANNGATILLQLGFEHETPKQATRLAASISRFRELSPDTRILVLCNSKAEISTLDALGLETRFVNQNCFIDERRLRPMGGKERPYDAAYLARMTPFKRHSLIPVELSPRLLLLGTAAADERIVQHDGGVYVDGIVTRYAAARQVDNFPGVKISELLALANCGLTLSHAEGACFASAEYFLCGLPVVDTPALGGRSVLFPEEFAREVDETPEAVGEGVAYWREHRPDPWKVRSAWLAKAAPHRDAYRKLMRELTGHTPRCIPHKLSLRTPHVGAFWSKAFQAYLLIRGFSRGLSHEMSCREP